MAGHATAFICHVYTARIECFCYFLKKLFSYPLKHKTGEIPAVATIAQSCTYVNHFWLRLYCFRAEINVDKFKIGFRRGPSLLQLRDRSTISALIRRSEFEPLDKVAVFQEMVNVILQGTGAEAVDDPDAGRACHVRFVDEAVEFVLGVGGGFADEI